MKVLHFVQMMKSLGHTVYHYGAEGSEVECDEHVDIITRAEQEQFFGPWDINTLYDVDWSGKSPYWPLTNGRAAAAINARKQRGDFLCVICGPLNIPLVQAVGNDCLAVEYGIGYNGTFANYRVFESYAHMHRIWGQNCPGRDIDGRFYDVVIPNYFDPADLPYKAIKEDYFLYMGRLVTRKGIHIAVETCKRLGVKLVVAGQGVKEQHGNRIVCMDGGVYDGVEYAGCVIGAEKAKLLQNAKAVFVPTTYVEPFGGVAVEAHFAGTPAITTDWGAFPETVEHGKTGFRCRTLDQFVWAAQHVGDLNPQYIHDRAVANYSMDRVRWMYEEYFTMLRDLWGTGWYELHPERQNLDWLNKRA
ncbi:MAG: glycosyltransferase [Candidatus Cryosericum sp.]